jgi:hypothetical protein
MTGPLHPKAGGFASGPAASGSRAGPVNRRWRSRRAWRLHATLLVVVPGCLAAGWFELTRALAGNELSWVYVFEWPFFAAFAAHLWWRLLREGEDAGLAPTPRTPDAAGDGPPDPQLEAWNEYLARLNAQSPPGGPPEDY